MAQVGRPKKIKFQNSKGMHDILAWDFQYYEKILDICKEMAKYYNFNRIETPILEQADLFTKGVGISTEIVQKQMYVLKMKDGDDLALRPEGTASVARAYIQKGMGSLSKPVKLWYFGPFFRHENPQEGRFRQFYQFGFEVLGERSPVVDARIIQIFISILKALTLDDLIVQVNSIGCQKCRGHYRKFLVKHLKSNQSKLCLDCKKRTKLNPFRVLDCKQEKCQTVVDQGPQILDHLCKECHLHFKQVLEFLDSLKISYELNPYLVRGLDYYTKTVFEVFYKKTIQENESFKSALVGGGRYDGLVELLGGKDTSGCGGACGVERVIKLMKATEFKFQKSKSPQIFLAQIGYISKKRALGIFEEFRKAKIPVSEAFSRDSLTVQLAKANKLGAKYTILLGEKETMENNVILRDMETKEQKSLKLDKVVKEIKKILN